MAGEDRDANQCVIVGNNRSGCAHESGCDAQVREEGWSVGGDDLIEKSALAQLLDATSIYGEVKEHSEKDWWP